MRLSFKEFLKLATPKFLTIYVTDSSAYALHRSYFFFNFKHVVSFILHPIKSTDGENDSLSSSPGPLKF